MTVRRWWVRRHGLSTRRTCCFVADRLVSSSSRLCVGCSLRGNRCTVEQRATTHLKQFTTGCLQLLEILEISLNLYGPTGNFCVKCRWSTALVSSHDETGYRIAYLRNWSSFFIFATPPYFALSCFCSIFRQTCRFGTSHIAGWSNANMSWIFLEIPPGISLKSGNLFS